MSVGSIGLSRELLVARKILAGNMSPSPIFGDQKLSADYRAEIANRNVREYLNNLNIPLERLRVLNPQRDYSQPLGLVEVDGAETINNGLNKLAKSSDFIYTYNPETVLGVTPADCPIIISRGQTPKGPILCYTHIAWRGAEAGYVDQMFERFQDLDVDFDSLNLYISCGARSDNYPYVSDENPLKNNPDKNLLFKNVTLNDDGKYHFQIDTPVFIRDQLFKNGLSEYQIFQDTSDTARQDSGYHSHGRITRSSNNLETNGRDLLISSMTDYSAKALPKIDI